MAHTMTVIFDGEVFRPTEPVTLPAGAEYQVTIEDGAVPPTKDESPLLQYLDLIEELDLPSDFAAQHHHYLYGTPKR